MVTGGPLTVALNAVFLEEVQESVRGYLRLLESRGAILGGDCWVDPDLNLPEVIMGGQVIFDFAITPPPPAERITFRAHVVSDWVYTIFEGAAPRVIPTPAA